MRLTILASGSRGNTLLIEGSHGCCAVDAGIAPRALRRRLRDLGRPTPKIDGIIVTHAHGDHARHSESYHRSFSAKIYTTVDAAKPWGLLRRPFVQLISPACRFELSGMTFSTIGLPHDTPQLGLSFECEGVKVGLATDLGGTPEGLSEFLSGNQIVLIESNHDPAMLKDGPYPPFLKRRISSGQGHLSNEQTAELLASLGPDTRDVVLMHLSETNNRPDLARRSARRALRGRGIRIHVASQRNPLVLVAEPT